MSSSLQEGHDETQADRMVVVIYAAKSDEDKHGSIPDQLRDCRQKASAQGWEVLAERTDEAFSAYKGNRGPGLEDAKRLAAEAAVSRGHAVLLAQHSDRFARGPGDAPGAADHLAKVLFWALRRNVELRSVEDDDSLTNPLLAFVMGQRNYEDSRRKSTAVKGGLRRRAERGMASGGPRAYGYRQRDVTPEGRPTGPLVPNPPEDVVVCRIFEEYAAGLAYGGIARRLNVEGIRTRNGKLWATRRSSG